MIPGALSPDSDNDLPLPYFRLPLSSRIDSSDGRSSEDDIPVDKEAIMEDLAFIIAGGPVAKDAPGDSKITVIPRTDGEFGPCPRMRELD